MENKEHGQSFIPESAEKRGVLGSRIEHNPYSVDVRWKDGVETTLHFPVIGFEVVDKGGKRIGYIKGDKALQILKERTGQLTHDEHTHEFTWAEFV